jgi:hypothetical protein
MGGERSETIHVTAFQSAVIRRQPSMSLDIDVARVRAVLLPSGWMDVQPGSFEIDAYKFHDDGMAVQSGRQDGATSTGFRFRDANGNLVCGPMTSIMALRLLASAAES